ncbi:hypothetical protein [Paenibacillus herberti]|uniref:Uncharacterized protein n=1 Tax=Paenibacillus herberti TaxID=1619309 RepID=A0A229P1U8_9BACL|nr:hypothetical protein [Paenibacillus herberti]OXM15934.1 hypothetical protein CGZ75_04285 [Paenibacillus herberti]
MKPGMILVLFILLVVVTSIFRSSLNDRDLQNDDLVTQGSIGFNVYNETSEYILRATKLEGSFEYPTPPLHAIYPNGYMHFEVETSFFSSREATVSYSIFTNTRIEQNVGIIIIIMRTANYTPKTRISDFRVYSDEVSLDYENGNTWVTVKND